MTERPQLVKRTRGWISKSRSFHYEQRLKHRKVRRLGRTRMTFTTGQTITNSGAFFIAGSSGSAGLPTWAFWGVLLGGFLAGKYLFPVPDSSIASRRGPADVVAQSAAGLDSMTPEEIKIYENNMVLKYSLNGPRELGTEQALQRQRVAAQEAEESTGMTAGSLSGLSVYGTEAYCAASAQHNLLRSRWLAYEVDPKLQFDFPAMSDPSFPATAAMIRAMQKAEQAKPEGNTANYQAAVAGFRQALAAAEATAGVPPH